MKSFLNRSNYQKDCVAFHMSVEAVGSRINCGVIEIKEKKFQVSSHAIVSAIFQSSMV